MVRRALLPLLVSSLALVGAPAAQDAGGTDGPSLEDALERIRERGREARAILEPRVTDLIARLDALGPAPGEDRLSAVRRDLVALPAEAAPLLVPHLETPREPTPIESRRAEEVATALRSIGTANVVDELVVLIDHGPGSTARRAIDLLADTKTRRSSRALRALAAEDHVQLAARAFFALVRSDDESDHAVVLAEAKGVDPRRVSAALGALASVEIDAARPAVRAMLANAPTALAHLNAVLGYYASRPKHFGNDEAQLLANLAARKAVSDREVIQLFDAAADFHDGSRAPWLTALRKAAELRTGNTRSECLVALARLGDRPARRELLEPLDEQLEENERNGAAYANRAKLLLRLDDFDAAARDFRRALDILRAPASRQDAAIGLAYAYAGAGKLRQASEALEDVQLSEVMLAQLREDPAFAELLAHKRYGKVLR